MPSDKHVRGLTNEVERRRIQQEIERALKRSEELRRAVQEITDMYRAKERDRR
jgi:hypothetical protein